MTNPQVTDQAQSEPPNAQFHTGRSRGWLDEAPSNSQIAFAKRFRLGIIVFLVSATGGVLLWHLFAPFQHPNVHMLLLSGERTVTQAPPFDEADLLISSADRIAPPADFVAEDFQAFEALKGVLSLKTKGDASNVEGDLQELLDLRRLTATLDRMVADEDDVLIVFASMRTNVEDGDPKFLLNVQPGFIDEGQCRLEEILRKVSGIRAAVKLFIIDTGRFDRNSTHGIVLNDFPRRLKREVELTGDANLWVLCSNRDLERSHVSRALERSVFGWFVELGLIGAADFNHDWLVDVDEFSRFVGKEVSEFVRQTSGGSANQTPQLFWGGGAITPQQELPGILPIAKKRINSFKVENPANWLQSSSQPAIGSSFSQIPKSPVTFDSNLNLQNTIGISPSLSPEAMSSAIPVSQEIRGLGTVRINPFAISKPATTTKPQTKVAKGNPTSPSNDTDLASAKPGVDKNGVQDDSEEISADQHAPLDPKQTIELAKLINQSWELRDELERQRWYGANPSITAPEEWRVLIEKLFMQGQMFRAARISDQRQVAVVVKTIHDGLKALAQDESLTFRPGHDERISQLIRRLQNRMKNQPCNSFRPNSFGMAELLARQSAQPIDASIDDAIKAFDQLVDSGTAEQFNEWSEKLDPSLNQFIEIECATQFASVPNLSWQARQTAMRACRVAERVANLYWTNAIWTGRDFDDAERMRKIGERTLLDLIGADREIEGVRSLQQAIVKYEQAARNLHEVAAAEELCDLLVGRLPQYVKWYRESYGIAATGTKIDDLRKLSIELAELVERLDETVRDERNEIQNLASRLSIIRDQIESTIAAKQAETISKAAFLPGDHLQMEALLGTLLPTAGVRLQLLKSLIDVDRRNVAQLELPHLFPSIIDQSTGELSDWALPVRKLELELMVPQVGAVHFPSLRAELVTLDTMIREMRDSLAKSLDADTPAEFEDLLWNKYGNFSNALKRLYENWKGQIAFASKVPSFASDLTDRAKQRRALRTARRGLSMLPVDAINLDEISSPTASLDLTDAFSLLTWHASRYEASRIGTPRREAELLTSRIEACRTMAARLPLQPPLTPASSARITWEGPRMLSLADSEEQIIELRLNWIGAAKTPAWIRFHFDPSSVEIKVSSEIPIQLQTSTAFVEPFMTTNTSPSLELSPDKPAILRVSIRRKEKATGETPLIVYAITSKETTRHDIAVSLPAKRTLDLQIEGLTGTWANTNQRFHLHPFANRTTSYAFALVNRETHPREVFVQILAPHRPIRIDSPQSELSSGEVAKLLDSLGAAETLVQLNQVNLPADPTPVKIPFPKPASEPEAPSIRKTTPIAPHGVVIIVSDKESGGCLVSIVDIAPQRPRRFLRPQVRYNADRERIEISVAPIDPDLLPQNGVKVQAEILETLPNHFIRELEGEIVSPGFEAKMFVEIPTSPDRIVTLEISVDDYPRAFRYRVPLSGNTGNLPEFLDAMSVAITFPKPYAAYQSPLDNLPIEFKLDAPDGAFRIPSDRLEVGIDRDNDRDFRDEPVLTLKADRQVEVTQLQFGPNGNLNLNVRVGDFKVLVPATGVRNANTQLLARLTVSDRTVWSQPVPIVIDGTGPRIQKVRQSPAGPVTAGAPLKITISASDNDLSGLTQVEMAFDMDRTGRISDTAKVIPAALNRDQNWEATIPTADLKPGTNTLLIRARDQVGNVSEVTKVKIAVISEEEATLLSMAPVSLNGIVLFQERPIGDVKLTAVAAEGPSVLPTSTNEQGQFELRGLVPGKWKIKAKGIVRNKTRVVESELEIKPSVAPQPLKLILK